jgi:hypothetical protein
MAQGNELGTQTSEVTEDMGVSVYSESMSIPMMGASQETEVRFRAEGPEMISANQTFSGAFSATTEIAYDGLHVTGSGQNPDPTTGQVSTVEIDTTLAPGTIDLNLMQVLLPTLSLEEGATFAITAFDGSEGKVVTPTVSVGAVESVTVPAGTFDAYRVQLLGLDTETVFYVSTQAPRRIVKMEIVGQPVELVLTQ